MSFSLSSIYQQTPALRELEEQIQNDLENQQSFTQNLKNIINQANDLTMPESFRLLTILAKNLKSSNSIEKKFKILLITKQIFLTAKHHFYIFGSIKILPWAKNISLFQIKKKQRQRVKLFLQQLSLKGNGDDIVQQRYCYKLLAFTEEYLRWFSTYFPFHINALYQFPSTFNRTFRSVQNQRTNQNAQFEYFQEEDYEKFKKNFDILKCQSSLQIKQLCDFVGVQIRATIDREKQKNQLLKQIVKTADSYCIRSIISQFTHLLQDSNKLQYTIKLLSYLVNQAEIQFIELAKLYCLPIILEYIIEIDFKTGKRTKTTTRNCSIDDEKLMIDSIYIWKQICLETGVSNELYCTAIKQMQCKKKPIFHVQKKHYAEFSTNLIDMHHTNSQKKDNIIEPKIQQELIVIFKIKNASNEERKVPELWRSNFSAINQLDQFAQSRVNLRKKPQTSEPFWKSKASNVSSIKIERKTAFFKSNALDSQKAAPINYGICQDKIAPNNSNVSYQNNNQILYGFKEGSYHIQQASDVSKDFQLQKLPNQSIKMSEEEPVKDLPIKPPTVFYDERKDPKKIQPKRPINDAQGSSYVAFNASNFSSFSQYSIKNSNPNLFKNTEGRKSRLKKIKESSLKSSLSSKKDTHKSASIIYFTNSHQLNSVSQSKVQALPFHNRNLLKVSEPNDQFIGIIPEQYSNLDHKINKNPNHISEQSNSPMTSSNCSSKLSSKTQHFENSLKSLNGSSSTESKIIDYGVQGYILPEPTKKLQFGFNKKYANILNSDTINIYQQDNRQTRNNLFDNILSSEGSQLMNSNQFTKTNNRFINSGNILESQGRQISQIRQNKKHFKQTNKFYQTGTQKLISEHNEYSQNSSEIKDLQLRKYQLNQSRDLRKLVQSKSANTLVRNSPQKIKSQKNKYIIEEYQNDQVLELEREMARIRKQKHQKEKNLKLKESEYRKLKLESAENQENREHLRHLKKQNEIIQLLMYQKNKEDYQIENYQDMVVQPVRNCNQIQDYFLENQVKGIYTQYVHPFERMFAKQILGTRCLLIKNQCLELGYNYSQRQNQISLYLTLFKSYDTVNIKVLENSILIDKEVDLNLNDQPAYNQLKIKRKISGINQKRKQPTFSQVINQHPSHIIIYPQVYISLSQKQIKENHEFSARIPCSIFNLAIPLEITTQIIKKLKNRKVIKSTQLPIGEQFYRNPKQKIAKYFPKLMTLTGGWYLIGFEYPHNLFGNKSPDFIKFRAQNKKIQFQFFGEPKTPLIQTIVCILTGEQQIR